ncbi:MAG TPA: biosynthetic arginine decarboxylase, partial [Polyangiaceae bacterium]|nr:biosynthetic arginine decarboxylase [Polyangiaceae bacterium]
MAQTAPSGTDRPEPTNGVTAEAMPDWTIEDARELYLVKRWGSGYFDVDEAGQLVAMPDGPKGPKIPVADVVAEARRENLATPILIRFQDILRHRVKKLSAAFESAVDDNKFRGKYRGVFPIKVNQLREVVEEILDAGRSSHFGIEVGSKPEMFAALSIHSDNDSLIVCNGYKDDGFIRTALLGRKLGKRVILIAEKLSEVRSIVRISKEMNVEPMIGLRCRLVSKGAGKWATSAGEHAKFGLTTSEILEAIDILKEANLSASFKLLHFHIGSQVPDIQIIKRAVREAARHYAKLRKMGQPIEYLDVGGGLAIDYDGSRSTFHSSMNYSLEEYARDVIYNIGDICDEEKVPHPDVISESGRAIVAHHSVLVVEAFGSIEKAVSLEPRPVEHKFVTELVDIDRDLKVETLGESWNDIVAVKEEAQKRFELGLLDLPVKARVEELFWSLARRMIAIARQRDDIELPDSLQDLKPQIADQFICNFSVFQSLLDHWALGALFPIVPIQRLDERPTNESTIVDITCDSDGKISKFIDIADVKDTLPLHAFDGRPYYLGVFLTGAYQDIMGDIHNLFGRVNEVHVFLDEDEDCGYYIEETISGNTIRDVLAMTQWDTHDLVSKVKTQVDAAIKQDRLKPTEGMRLIAEYERG